MKILTKEMQEEGKEYVYLAEFVGGYCKIGVSKNPTQRLKNIEKCNQIPVKNYFLVEGYFELENILHKHFKEKRRYSEWFDISIDELVGYVSNLENLVLVKNKHNDKKEKKKICTNGFYYKDDKALEVLKNGDFDVLRFSDKCIDLINSYVYKSEINTKFKNFEKDKKEYLEVCKELGIEEYFSAIEDLTSIKTYEDFILNFTEYVFLNNYIFKRYLKGEISYIDVIKELVREISELLKQKKKGIVNIRFTGLQDLESKIATLIEFADTDNMTDKEVYAMVKIYIDKQIKM